MPLHIAGPGLLSAVFVGYVVVRLVRQALGLW